jgi:hypothetical protein
MLSFFGLRIVSEPNLRAFLETQASDGGNAQLGGAEATTKERFP